MPRACLFVLENLEPLPPLIFASAAEFSCLGTGNREERVAACCRALSVFYRFAS